jgi:hypothetical protein
MSDFDNNIWEFFCNISDKNDKIFETPDKDILDVFNKHRFNKIRELQLKKDLNIFFNSFDLSSLITYLQSNKYPRKNRKSWCKTIKTKFEKIIGSSINEYHAYMKQTKEYENDELDNMYNTKNINETVFHLMEVIYNYYKEIDDYRWPGIWNYDSFSSSSDPDQDSGSE